MGRKQLYSWAYAYNVLKCEILVQTIKKTESKTVCCTSVYNLLFITVLFFLIIPARYLLPVELMVACYIVGN